MLHKRIYMHITIMCTPFTMNNMLLDPEYMPQPIYQPTGERLPLDEHKHKTSKLFMLARHSCAFILTMKTDIALSHCG